MHDHACLWLLARPLGPPKCNCVRRLRPPLINDKSTSRLMRVVGKVSPARFNRSILHKRKVDAESRNVRQSRSHAGVCKCSDPSLSNLTNQKFLCLLYLRGEFFTNFSVRDRGHCRKFGGNTSCSSNTFATKLAIYKFRGLLNSQADFAVSACSYQYPH